MSNGKTSFENGAAYIFEIDIDAVRTSILEFFRKAWAAVVDTSVQAKLFHDEPALLLASRDPNGPAASQFRDLADDLANSARSSRYRYRLPWLWLADIQ